MYFPATHRTLNCMVGQMKHILATEQKKTDFRPEDENNVMIQYTTVRQQAHMQNKTNQHFWKCKLHTAHAHLFLKVESIGSFYMFLLCLFLPGRPAPKYAPTSVGRWSTCGSLWMAKMWTQCWRSWACVSTDSSMSTYSSTATAPWEACWPSATWLNTDDAPRTSGWAGGGA